MSTKLSLNSIEAVYGNPLLTSVRFGSRGRQAHELSAAV
jgi:hypothetical protein